MKPILVFTWTGEHRKAKKDEWYKNDYGSFMLWTGKRASEYDIYTLTEIPVPEGASILSYSFERTDKNGMADDAVFGYIPLPRAQS